MAQINRPSDYFNTVLYTGNGSTQSITGVNFQPDFTWIKIRSEVNHHRFLDSIRGATKELYSDLTSAEVTGANGLTSFDSDGFSLGTDHGFNKSSATYASWNWLANGSGSANTDGSISSTVSANTTSGFSVVTWTAGSGVGSIGHGLGVEPSMIIVKGRVTADPIGWVTGLKSNGWNNYLTLQSSNANNNDQRMFSPSGESDPTSTVWYQDQAALGISGDTMVGYVFAEKKGYSKFGSYTGNGSTDGTFVYTGLKPAFLIIKRTDSAGYSWMIIDNKRNEYNVMGKGLFPDDSGAEYDYTTVCDFLSNGFKMRDSGTGRNASGGTYIYMAFAQNPLVGSNGVPCTAR